MILLKWKFKMDDMGKTNIPTKCSFTLSPSSSLSAPPTIQVAMEIKSTITDFSESVARHKVLAPPNP